MSPYYVCCGYDLHLNRSVADFSIYLRYCSAACIYFSFRWGPFLHSLGIVQWDSTRREGYPGRVSGSGPVRSADQDGLEGTPQYTSQVEMTSEGSDRLALAGCVWSYKTKKCANRAGN